MMQVRFSHIMIIMLIGVAILLPTKSYADTSGSIAVTFTYTNGDTADYYPISLKIYQDFSTSPYREIESVTGNPFNIVSLPANHHYKIEAYANSMYASVAYVDLQDTHQDVTVKLPLPGGMRVNVFYNDGLTPIANATVYVRSQDNDTWAHGITDADGKTMRFWIGPTILQEDHYIVDAKIGEHLVYSDSPVFLRSGLSQEIKVVTNWPPVVNNKITVRAIDDNSQPFITQEMYMINAWNNGKMVAEAPLTQRGEAYFSNIKVGDYQFKAIKTSDGSEWGNLNVTIDGSKTVFDLQKSQPPQETPGTPPVTPPPPVTPVTPGTPSQETSVSPPANSCMCVAFRLDNIQDYWLDDVQSAIIDMFAQKNTSLTLGIIGNVFGDDAKLVEHIKAKAQSGITDVGMNGWNFEDFTTLDQQEQEQLLEQSKSKIVASLGVTPSVFIPPYGKVNNSTLSAMSDTGIDVLSAPPNAVSTSNLRNIHYLQSAVRVTYSGVQNGTNESIMSDIRKAVNANGFAIVTLSFQDYAQDNGTVKMNVPDAKKIQNLQGLIDSVKNSGYNITTVKEIARPASVPEFGPTAVLTVTIASIMSLVAARRFSLK